MNGIKIYDDAPGTGKAAEIGDEVAARCRFSLNRGEPVSGMGEVTVTFRIGSRSVIAGLEKGVIGMMVGGRRTLRISPHLACRDAGLPERIPRRQVMDASREWPLLFDLMARLAQDHGDEQVRLVAWFDR